MTGIYKLQRKNELRRDAILPHILFLKGKPVCLCCGEPMRDNGIKSRDDFGEAEEEVGGIDRPVKQRFEHLKLAAARVCPPYALRTLKRFELSARKFDFRVDAQNERLLNEPQNKQLYEAVLRRLAFALTRCEPMAEMLKVANLARGSQEFAQAHPWAMAYDVFYHSRFTSKRSGLVFSFRGVGQQELNYNSSTGMPRSILLPHTLELMKQHKGGELKLVRNPDTGEKCSFTVSRQAVLDLVELNPPNVTRPFWEPKSLHEEIDVA